MKNIKIGDKIVYDWMATTDYILVKTIDNMKTEEGGFIKMINKKYSITGPLRSPTQKEIIIANFK